MDQMIKLESTRRTRCMAFWYKLHDLLITGLILSIVFFFCCSRNKIEANTNSKQINRGIILPGVIISFDVFLSVFTPLMTIIQKISFTYGLQNEHSLRSRFHGFGISVSAKRRKNLSDTFTA